MEIALWIIIAIYGTVGFIVAWLVWSLMSQQGASWYQAGWRAALFGIFWPAFIIFLLIGQ